MLRNIYRIFVIGLLSLALFSCSKDNDDKVDVIKVKEIRLSLDKLTLKVGASQKVAISIVPEKATYPLVTLVSSNPLIATADAEGNITAISKGTAVLTAVCEDNVTAKITVTVTSASSGDEGGDVDNNNFEIPDFMIGVAKPYHFYLKSLSRRTLYNEAMIKKYLLDDSMSDEQKQNWVNGQKTELTYTINADKTIICTVPLSGGASRDVNGVIKKLSDNQYVAVFDVEAANIADIDNLKEQFISIDAAKYGASTFSITKPFNTSFDSIILYNNIVK
ncbi:Ig domain-containing protein [Marinilabiliaceae bacterium JC040]|nr:Ig domain-containing protein [Marinilabiliaceae bacterium JC040]